MYYLTGNTLFKNTVVGLADWVINMDDGAKTIFRFVDRGYTGLATRTLTDDFHGAGRGAGNSLNALLDADELTGEEKYFKKAEEIIKRAVHPKDNLKEIDLFNAEDRWFYLMFLESLQKYLARKTEKNQLDYMFHYARQSLLHYVRWMLENEKPYREQKDRILIWTETWPAHDMRKSFVFANAAKYAESSEERINFLMKAEYFYYDCISDIINYPTRNFTRPVVILLRYGIGYPAIKSCIEKHKIIPSENFDFGEPQKFIPQKLRVKNKIAKILFRKR
jgi:hypothetical protein